MKKIFKINGLDCLSCKAKLEEIINNIEGVVCEVDFENEVAEISFSSQDKQDEVIKKIKDAGYDAIEI